MDRYWGELEHARLRHAATENDPVIGCPLGTPPLHSHVQHRAWRAWQKYVAYPLLAWRASRRPGVRVVHVLDHSYAHLLAQVPARGVYKIVTVHDLAPLRDPSGLTEAQQRRFRRTVEHLRAADLLLAVSRYSAQEVTALLDIDPARVTVLPEGVDNTRFSTVSGSTMPAGEIAALSGRQVVLSVGAVVPRKNLQILPDVFRALNAGSVTLLRIGAPLPDELREQLRSVLGHGGLVELGAARDEVLVQAYQRADALILPSRIEGFGFPVLEAMAAGCPVVCTNVASLPEVGGGAALYFAPDDPRTAAAHLHRIFTDAACRGSLAVAGRQQAASFSWARYFERLLEIYRAAPGVAQAAP